MDRRTRLGLAAALALVVTAGAAGSAAAAPGGISDVRPQLCQNGGYANLYDARTVLPFTSAPACVSYGLKGNAYSSLTMSTKTAPCGRSCWGFVSGLGLKPGASFQVQSASSLGRPLSATGRVPANGSISGGPLLRCGLTATGVYATSTTWAGAPITSNAVNTPCG